MHRTQSCDATEAEAPNCYFFFFAFFTFVFAFFFAFLATV
jgi:hypothetical protein